MLRFFWRIFRASYSLHLLLPLAVSVADEHFIIETSSQAVSVAAGFSGHRFKFCSVVGEILADLALEGGTSHDISLFRSDRLR